MTTFSFPSAISASALAGILATGNLTALDEKRSEVTTFRSSPVLEGAGQSWNSVSFDVQSADRQREKLILLGLITKSVGPTSLFLPNEIDAVTAFYASMIIMQIPETLPMPRVGPDSDGDLVMVWEGKSTVLAAVERSSIYFVINPGTMLAQHFNSIALRGRSLPPELVAALKSV